MVDILPFRGLRYNLDQLAQTGASLDDVVTPPYDVIDEAGQAALYARHPANFIRLDLGRKYPDDTPTNNPYTRAAASIQQWESDGTLTPEDQPAFYAYSQTWQEHGKTIERKGMIALLKLTEFESGDVLPHEHTLKGPKQDRLQLMQHTLCGLSQVFMIYRDTERLMEGLLYEQAAAHHGWAHATDQDGVIHRFKPVSDSTVIQRLQALFADKTLLIADGHHRYETALGFAREVREIVRRQTGQEPPPGSLLSDYGMVFLCNMDDPGLKVYPTHRILYQWPPGWDADRFEPRLFERFERVDTQETLGYRRAGTTDLIPLRLKPEFIPDLPDGLRSFDAALLEEVVFKGILGQSGEDLKAAHQLGFYRDETAIDRLWANHEAVAGFYLQAPSVPLVHAICQAGHRMPQKSTYFYPKILSGLVLFPYRPFLKQPGQALSGSREQAIQPLPEDFQFPEAVFSQRSY